jgi:hypothetical protein
MTEQRAPKGNEWADVVEVLHGVANMMTVRTHYYEGHPAIAQADALAAEGFTRILAKVSEIVVALIDGEFVICERPLPELRARLHVLADAMVRHDIECVVFQHGMTQEEATFFGKTLAIPADAPGRVRDHAQQGLTHILLRFAELKEKDALGAKLGDAAYLVPYVQDMLVDLARSLATEQPIERLTLMSAAQQIVTICRQRTFTLVPRCFTRSFYDEATHATNVAMMTAAMATPSARASTSPRARSSTTSVTSSCRRRSAGCPSRSSIRRRCRSSATTPSPARRRSCSRDARRSGSRRRSSTIAASTARATRSSSRASRRTSSCA